MMPSRTGLKGGPSNQKKVVTYGKTSHSRPPSESTSMSEPNPYDFPESDASGSSPPRIKPKSHKIKPAASLPRPNPTHASSDTRRAPSPTKKKDDDNDARKRKHSKAFADDGAAMKSSSQPIPSASRPRMRKEQSNPETVRPHKPSSVAIQQSSSNPASRPTVLSGSQMAVRPSPTLERSNSAPRTGPTILQTRKVRLIDRLASQKEIESDSESDSSGSADVDLPARLNRLTPMSQQANTPMEWSQSKAEQTKTPVSRKIKHTYSQNRSIRGDTQQSEGPFGMSADSQLESLLSSPPVTASAAPFSLPADDFDLDDDLDEDDGPKSAIKSVHELRRAGANNRFADEMEDLLSRIGAPSRGQLSMRRNSLLELAQKLQRDDFSAQFRDHVARDNIAKGIGEEVDVITGFAFTSSLVIFLSSNNAPHLLRRLVEERIGKMLGELLRVSDDIEILAAQRAMNMSKAGRASLMGIKSFLLRKPIWLGHRPKLLSPRTLALQLLSILHLHLESRYLEEVIQDSEYELQKIVELEESESLEEDTDLALIVVILHSRSGAELAGTDRTQSMARTEKIFQFLEQTLERWPRERGQIVPSTLKLAINTTNVEDGARAFGKEGLLRILGRCIWEGLRQIQDAVDKNAFQGDLYDELLLVLGVTINILEHHAPSRALFDKENVERLAALYMDNQEAVGDADSEQKSKVSVAFGYLAVLLGYLSLQEQARGIIQLHNDGSGLRRLIESIREFIGFFRSVDNKVHELEGLVSDLQQHGR